MSEPIRYIGKSQDSEDESQVAVFMGRVGKGQKCSVTGCSNDAVRSLAGDKVMAAGLKVGTVRHAYLCKEHYKEFKKETKKDRTVEKWRHGTPS